MASAAAVTVAASVAALASATPPSTGDGRIAFQRYLFQDDPLQADIWTANADGSAERRVTRAPRGMIDGEPDWSPDGRRIAFQRGPSVDGPWTLWIANADGSALERLSPTRGRCLDESSPAFAPDGKRIAFECHVHTRRGELFSILVVDLASGKRHTVVSGTGAAGVGRPQFSPDGRQVVFDRQNIGTRPTNGHATFVANVDGTGLRRVTPWSLRAGDHPDWSPDGTLILVRSNANGPDFGRQRNLFVVRPDGGGLRRLTRSGADVRLLQNGSFSPDGKAIVFATTRGAARIGGSDLPDVFTLELDGGAAKPVTRIKNWDGSPDWGPTTH